VTVNEAVQNTIPRRADGGQTTLTGVTSRPELALVVTIGRSLVTPVLRMTSWRCTVARGRMRRTIVCVFLSWPLNCSVIVMLPPRQSVEPGLQRGWLTAATIGAVRNARIAFDTRLICASGLLVVTRFCGPTSTRIWVLPGAEAAETLRRGPLLGPLGSGVVSLAEPRISITEGTVPVVAEKTVQ
jgi:hypothetical protein